jgi:hypothetical protein
MLILGFDIYSIKDLNVCERAALSALSDLIGLPQFCKFREKIMRYGSFYSSISREIAEKDQ